MKTFILALTAVSLMFVGDPAISEDKIPLLRVPICHYDGQGTARLITVAASAVESHVANHGDHPQRTFYADRDQDGFGDPNSTVFGCTAPVGYTSNAGDCDDSDPTRQSCLPENCTAYEYNDHTYVYCLNRVNWYQAQAACQELGYNLVTINDYAENKWVVDTGITLAPSTDFNYGSWWSGANDVGHEGIWTWISGEPNTFQVFPAGEPNGGTGENCIHLRRYAEAPYGWNDANCSYWNWHYICESQ